MWVHQHFPFILGRLRVLITCLASAGDIKFQQEPRAPAAEPLSPQGASSAPLLSSILRLTRSSWLTDLCIFFVAFCFSPW